MPEIFYGSGKFGQGLRGFWMRELFPPVPIFIGLLYAAHLVWSSCFQKKSGAAGEGDAGADEEAPLVDAPVQAYGAT